MTLRALFPLCSLNPVAEFSTPPSFPRRDGKIFSDIPSLFSDLLLPLRANCEPGTDGFFLPGSTWSVQRAFPLFPSLQTEFSDICKFLQRHYLCSACRRSASGIFIFFRGFPLRPHEYALLAVPLAAALPFSRVQPCLRVDQLPYFGFVEDSAARALSFVQVFVFATKVFLDDVS